MPIYTYYCINCEKQFDKFHSMLEVPTVCDLCGAENSLTKQIPELGSIKKRDGGPKVGDLVKKHIEEARRDLKRDQKAATKEME